MCAGCVRRTFRSSNAARVAHGSCTRKIIRATQDMPHMEGSVMPRSQRNYLPGYPVHVTQRGVNGRDCFFSNDDRVHYLRSLAAVCHKYDVAVHAYVLMINHVHLLMTPSSQTGISSVMQSLGPRYVQYVNRRIGRTGTLWGSRHFGSVIETERYLLTCYRYVELNPVRAKMTDSPESYPWSSYRSNAYGEIDPLVTPHETYLALGKSRDTRLKNYRALFDVALSDEDLDAVRTATRSSTPLGSDEFRKRVEDQLSVDAGSLPDHSTRAKSPSTN